MIKLLRVLAGAAFFAFVLEIIAGGSGEAFSIAGISARYLVFATCVFCFALLKLAGFFSLAFPVSRVLSVSLFCVFIALWIVLLPLMYGHGIQHALKDAAPFLGAALLLLLFDRMLLLSYWPHVRVLVFGLLAAFAVLHIGIYAAGQIDLDLALKFADALKRVFESKSAEIEKFVFIVPSGEVARVYFGSSFLLLVGLYLVFAFSGRMGFIRTAIFFLVFCAAIFATETRSLIVAASVFILLYALVKRFRFRKPMRGIVVFVLLVLPLASSFFLLPTIDSAVIFDNTLSRGESDQIRPEQMAGLLDAYVKTPLAGRGFGASVDPVRNVDTPYSYELSMLALYMKIGIGGMLVLAASWALWLAPTIRRIDCTKYANVVGTYPLYCSMVVASFYNPYLFGFFGTFFVIFICLEFEYLSEVNR